MTHNIAARIEPWIDAALQRHGGEERFSFLVTLAGEPPSFVPAVVVWLPGPQLGSVISAMFTVNAPHNVTEEDVQQTVRGLCENMLRARSEQLRAMNGQGTEQP